MKPGTLFRFKSKANNPGAYIVAYEFNEDGNLVDRITIPINSVGMYLNDEFHLTMDDREAYAAIEFLYFEKKLFCLKISQLYEFEEINTKK